MSKYLVIILNIMVCTFILSLCLIYLIEFETWRDKSVAIILTLSFSYICTLISNKFLPIKIRILGGLFDLLSGPLLIIGVFACFAWLEPWSIKIIGTFIWVVCMLGIPSFLKKE